MQTGTINLSFLLSPQPLFHPRRRFLPTPSVLRRACAAERPTIRQRHPCQPVRMRTRPQISQKKRDAPLAFRPRPREGGGEQKRWPFFSSSSSLFRAVSFAPPRENGKEPLFLFPAENTKKEREGKSNWRRLAWERDLEEWLLPGSRRKNRRKCFPT